ncbi:MAG: pilin [Candidatus Paceibacterota bacterium]
MSTFLRTTHRALRYIGLTAVILLVPALDVFAQDDFTPLAPLPGIGEGEGGVGLSTYFTQMFILLLSLTTVFAVLMIVIGGLQYMTAGDSAGKVSAAKETIQNAIFGLFLAIGAWLILYTINPAILALNLTAEPVEYEGMYRFSYYQVQQGLSEVGIGSGSTGAQASDRAKANCFDKAREFESRNNVYNVNDSGCNNITSLVRSYGGPVMHGGTGASTWTARAIFRYDLVDRSDRRVRGGHHTQSECEFVRSTVATSIANQFGMSESDVELSPCAVYIER